MFYRSCGLNQSYYPGLGRCGTYLLSLSTCTSKNTEHNGCTRKERQSFSNMQILHFIVDLNTVVLSL